MNFNKYKMAGPAPLSHIEYLLGDLPNISVVFKRRGECYYHLTAKLKPVSDTAVYSSCSLSRIYDHISVLNKAETTYPDDMELKYVIHKELEQGAEAWIFNENKDYISFLAKLFGVGICTCSTKTEGDEHENNQ